MTPGTDPAATTQAEAQAAQATPDATGEPAEGCRLCEVVPAVLGLLAAGVIIFVSLDLLRGGALTVAAMRLIGRGGPDNDGSTATD